MSSEWTRREFGKLAMGTVLASSNPPARAKLWKPEPGIKIAVQLGSNFTDEDLAFAQQLGVQYVSIWVGGEEATAENFKRLKARVEAAGLKVWNIGNRDVHNMEEVTLNLPGRDQKIEQYLQYLRNIAEAGIYYTTYAHMGNGIWSTGREPTRGGAMARAFDLAKATSGWWNGKEFRGPLTHGRQYSEQELWENYTYFIRKVVPVAEELGIRIGIHPDDPPVYPLGGVPRCIFGTFEGFKRALEIANSPNIGVCLCVGCWLEGGQAMGCSPEEAIRYFGRQGKLFKIHFRNVSSPLPHFVETFVDAGYKDMYLVMKAIREVDFDGVIIADHVPQMVGGPRTAWAHAIAYIKCLVDRVNAEAHA